MFPALLTKEGLQAYLQKTAVFARLLFKPDVLSVIGIPPADHAAGLTTCQHLNLDLVAGEGELIRNFKVYLRVLRILENYIENPDAKSAVKLLANTVIPSDVANENSYVYSVGSTFGSYAYSVGSTVGSIVGSAMYQLALPVATFCSHSAMGQALYSYGKNYLPVNSDVLMVIAKWVYDNVPEAAELAQGVNDLNHFLPIAWEIYQECQQVDFSQVTAMMSFIQGVQQDKVHFLAPVNALLAMPEQAVLHEAFKENINKLMIAQSMPVQERIPGGKNRMKYLADVIPAVLQIVDYLLRLPNVNEFMQVLSLYRASLLDCIPILQEFEKTNQLNTLMSEQLSAFLQAMPVVDFTVLNERIAVLQQQVIRTESKIDQVDWNGSYDEYRKKIYAALQYYYGDDVLEKYGFHESGFMEIAADDPGLIKDAKLIVGFLNWLIYLEENSVIESIKSTVFGAMVAKAMQVIVPSCILLIQVLNRPHVVEDVSQAVAVTKTVVHAVKTSVSNTRDIFQALQSMSPASRNIKQELLQAFKSHYEPNLDDQNAKALYEQNYKNFAMILDFLSVSKDKMLKVTASLPDANRLKQLIVRYQQATVSEAAGNHLLAFFVGGTNAGATGRKFN